ncbi:hypothetical protein [Rossellomorea marisflavi]|nr:hypothetical protein [Rossellomorea marisflavi]
MKLIQNRLTHLELIVIKTLEGRIYKISVYGIIQDYDSCLLIEHDFYPHV